MKRTFLILFSLVLFISTDSFAQTKLTPEKLWQFGRVSDPQVSPNGKAVLYGVKTYDIKANKGTNIIYSIPVSGGNPVALSEAKQNIFSARWRPDGKKITYLSAESGEVQIYEMNADGSGKTQVTAVAGGVSGYKYSPKLNYIAYTADVKLDKEVKEIYPDLDKCNARIIDGLMYRHWDSWHDYAYSHLFIIGYADGKTTGEAKDLMKDEKFDCPLAPDGGDDEFNWHPDGTKIAYDCKKLTGTAEAVSTNSDIYVYDLNTMQNVNVSVMNTGYDRNPQYSADGNKLAWLSMEGAGNESDLNRLAMYDFRLNKILKADASVYITQKSNFDYTIDNFLWYGNDRVVFVAVKNATKQIFTIDLKGSTKQVTNGQHDFLSISVTGNSLVGGKMSIRRPTELVSIDLITGNETQLTFTNKTLLDDIKMGRVEERWVATTDGKKMLT